MDQLSGTGIDKSCVINQLTAPPNTRGAEVKLNGLLEGEVRNELSDSNDQYTRSQ